MQNLKRPSRFYNVKFRRGHYEIIDEHGNFVASADTYKEAYDEITAIIEKEDNER